MSQLRCEFVYLKRSQKAKDNPRKFESDNSVVNFLGKNQVDWDVHAPAYSH